MARDRAEIERLIVEAKRVRKNFRYLQQDLKRTPENVDLLRQRDVLKKRYEQIQAQLHEARAAGEAVPEDHGDDPDGQPVDMSIFEPKPFEIPAAVAVSTRRAAPAGGAGSTFTMKDLRTIVSVALLVVVVPFFYLYVVKQMRFYEVPSRSMEPTLVPGDRIVAVKPSAYARGDIVILPDPKSPGDYLVKRLVAFDGDTVEIANGNLFVNGQPIAEPYTNGPTDEAFRPTTVPAGEAFLLGDNRNNSEDSRAWGPGKTLDDLRGRVLWIYSPSSRRGAVADHTGAFGDVPAP